MIELIPDFTKFSLLELFNEIPFVIKRNSFPFFIVFVAKIIILPNGLKVLIVRHGEYFSVYSNLYEVNVQRDQKIKTKQVLGSIYNTNSQKRNVLGFQIWKSREKLNPTNWLSSY